MRKQDITPARTIADTNRKLSEKASAIVNSIDRSVAVSLAKQTAPQILELINSAQDIIKFGIGEDGRVVPTQGYIGGWVIDGEYIHSEKGEPVEYKVNVPLLGEKTFTFFVFLFMHNSGIKYRICTTDNFNGTSLIGDQSILTLLNFNTAELLKDLDITTLP